MRAVAASQGRFKFGKFEAEEVARRNLVAKEWSASHERKVHLVVLVETTVAEVAEL